MDLKMLLFQTQFYGQNILMQMAMDDVVALKHMIPSKRTPFFIVRCSNFVFSQQFNIPLIFEYLLRSINHHKEEVKKNEIVFLSLKKQHAKDFNCLLDHSFSMCISSFFYLFSISCNVVQLSSCYLYIKRGGVNLQNFVSQVFDLF